MEPRKQGEKNLAGICGNDSRRQPEKKRKKERKEKKNAA
jgi:hypothetical protein